MRIVPPQPAMYPWDVTREISFHVVGVSHHTAAVGVREQFALTRAELDELLAHEHAAGRAALLLFTCNRCELYWSGPHDYESWFRDLARARGVTYTGELTRFDGAEAVRHLFTVTAGLDSQILGETEILGQVRRAFDAARAAGTTTRDMDAIFSAALAAGRRVRHGTRLGPGHRVGRHATRLGGASGSARGGGAPVRGDSGVAAGRVGGGARRGRGRPERRRAAHDGSVGAAERTARGPLAPEGPSPRSR